MRRDLCRGPILGVGQQHFDRRAGLAADGLEVGKSEPLSDDIAGPSGLNDVVGVLSRETLVGRETLTGHELTVPNLHFALQPAPRAPAPSALISPGWPAGRRGRLDALFASTGGAGDRTQVKRCAVNNDYRYVLSGG